LFFPRVRVFGHDDGKLPWNDSNKGGSRTLQLWLPYPAIAVIGGVLLWLSRRKPQRERARFPVAPVDDRAK
jgi:hypothetical protein